MNKNDIDYISSKFRDLVNCPLHIISTITKSGIDDLKSKIVQVGKNNES